MLPFLKMNKRLLLCLFLKENVSVVHYNFVRGKTGRCTLKFRTTGVYIILLRWKSKVIQFPFHFWSRYP